MLGFCADWVPRSLASALDESSARFELLKECGLRHTAGGDLVEMLQTGRDNVILCEAGPDNLDVLLTHREAVDALADAGGWLLLWGLTPDGLERFNRLVGSEHMIRPFELEKSGFPEKRDALTDGLTEGQVAFYTHEPLARTFFTPSDRPFSHVVDAGDSIAAFAELPESGYWKRPGAAPCTDRWPRNMVNGFVGADDWHLGFVLNLDEGAPTEWDMRFPRHVTLDGFAITPGPYHPLKKIRLAFDGADPVEFEVAGKRERQDFHFDPRKASTVRVEREQVGRLTCALREF